MIHTHLAELGEVTSESIGRGNFKRIRVKLLPNSKHKRTQQASQNRNNNRGGRRGNNRNNNQRNFNRASEPRNFNKTEANGNVIEPEPVINEIDDNIGNRIDSSHEDSRKF